MAVKRDVVRTLDPYHPCSCYGVSPAQRRKQRVYTHNPKVEFTEEERGAGAGGNKKERTELPPCLRSNRARTHQHSETGQSFWSAISTAKEQSTGRGTQRKLRNKLTIQNGTRMCVDRTPTL